MKDTIYHNPHCSASRDTLALLCEAGLEPAIIEYFSNPLSTERIRETLALSGLAPRDMMRRKEALYDELGLNDPSLSDDALIEALHRHPVLMERPIVVTGNGARLCRPAEKVREVI